MSQKIIELISKELNLREVQVQNTIFLLDDGCTIPFISRYRKEMTQNLDEMVVGEIKDKKQYYTELEKRKVSILATIAEQEKLTPELRQKIENCFQSNELEDIYLPYKPRKRTRAQIAREKGLEGLSKFLMRQDGGTISNIVSKYVKGEVATVDDALQGARDIIAEWVSENEVARNIVRRSFDKAAHITCKVVKGKEEEASIYRDYFAVEESLKKISSHRLLAMRRGEDAGFLRVSIEPDESSPIHHLERLFLKHECDATEQVQLAIHDSYKRLLKPSIETEYAKLSKEKADEEAIRVFSTNLRQLLLAPPLGMSRVLAVDPGFRTGCKIVVLNEQCELEHNETIYPHTGQTDKLKASKKIAQLVSTYKIEAIAIGNGTASRETEQFIKDTKFDRDLKVFIVNEAGASIYSASAIAREEFGAFDVTVRGTVSIGRRLIDPLAELVKIDPKSVGVGQYQHDVDQAKLKESLTVVVESCVNHVGVDLNTASPYLLRYVSGIGPKLAEKIIEHRKINGSFTSREALKKVSGMGAKTFEQCAGFLRVSGASNPLDNSAVHPESYHIVETMAQDLKCTAAQLVANAELCKKISVEKYVTAKVGLPTLTDIVKELEKPGRDPRKMAKVMEFDANVRTINDLKLGMILQGIVNNVTKFGLFVDIGIKENGMVHISEIADRFISDPTEVVSLHAHVKVRVLEIDKERKRIALSMKGLN